MPTNIEIIQNMAVGLVEHPIKEVKESDPADNNCIPQSLSQANSAINKLIFLFHSRLNLEVDQRGLLRHIRALEFINDEIWAPQTGGMRQPKITGFFSLKHPVSAVPVAKSSDDLASLDDHNATKSSSPLGEVSAKFVN